MSAGGKNSFFLVDEKRPQDKANSADGEDDVGCFEYMFRSLWGKEGLAFRVDGCFLIVGVDDEGEDEVEDDGAG